MFASRHLLSCLLVVSLFALPLVAEESSEDERPKVKLSSYWAGMANKVNLDYDQRVKLKAALDAHRDAITELKPQIDRVIADRRAAKAAGNAEKANELKQKLADLREQEDKADADFLVAVRDLLNEDQVVDWEYHRLLYSMNRTFKKYELTDSQQQTLEQVTREAATKLAALEPDDVNGSDEIIEQTKNDFYLHHLTEAQQKKHPRDVE